MNYEVISNIMVEKALKLLPSVARADLQRAIWAAIQADPETAHSVANYVEHKLCPMCGHAPQEWADGAAEQKYFIKCPGCMLQSAPHDSSTEAWRQWDRRSVVR